MRAFSLGRKWYTIEVGFDKVDDRFEEVNSRDGRVEAPIANKRLWAEIQNKVRAMSVAPCQLTYRGNYRTAAVPRVRKRTDYQE
jgi:hypothetical protein